jgi:hypothetical protein
LTLDLAIAFSLSSAGLLFVLSSRNVRAKRVVLPLTLIVFHVLAFQAVQRSGALAQIPPAVVAAALALNAVYVARVVT